MPAPKVGQVINNKYRLLRHIGDGGMGSVYEARHETLGTTVALKFLHLEFARRDGLVQRFIQEARASARIQSPHVIRVSDVDQTPDGDVFIVLEYLEGQTLQALYEDLYRGGRKLPYADALDYAEQMIDGVEAAHAAGIIHRDLKPDNVMVTLDAKGNTVLKLLDFGIAKLRVMGAPEGANEQSLTRPGVMMGTPEYMAPEQATSADAVDARADVFALGVIIFEMLAGQRPVAGENPLELAAAYKAGNVTKLAELVPGVSPELCSVVHRAIAANASDRFASVADMREAIAPFAAAVRPPPASRLRPGGTIGVVLAPDASVPHEAPKFVALGVKKGDSGSPAAPVSTASPPRPLAAPPPPTAESKPIGAGVAKTWPPDADSPPNPVSTGNPAGVPAPTARGGTDPPRSFGTVVDPEPVSAVQVGPDRTHRIGQPYAPDAAPPAVVALASTGSSGVGSRAFLLDQTGSPNASGPGTLRGHLPAPSRRSRRTGMSIGAVLVAAAGVAFAVTGLAYLASRGSSSRDDDAPGSPTTPNSPQIVPQGPQGGPGQRPADPSDPPPFIPPQAVPVPQPPGGPVGPPGKSAPGGRPKGSPTGPSPSAPAAPSATPSAEPNAPPALVLPSALPFPNPFDPGE